MLGSRKIIAFLATTNAARTEAFYRDTLGLELVAVEEWALVFEVGGTMLRIQKVREHTPPGYTVLGWHVPDVAQEVAALVDQGVTFERYPYLQQDEAGIWTAPSGAKVAWFKDPDGNTLSLTQLPLVAKF
jgi:catechol 2,3-dioxygenase-like lactoylglutathione lyase family enzyme